MKKLILLGLALAILLGAMAFDTSQVKASITIGISTSTYATAASFQSRLFYANGYFWAFYYDGSYVVYQTSQDGSTWSLPTIVTGTYFGGGGFDVLVNGSNVYYVAILENDSNGVKYVVFNNGTINGSTITWGNETMIFIGSLNFRGGAIAEATDGKLMIVFQSFGIGPSGNIGWSAYESSDNGASWTSALLGFGWWANLGNPPSGEHSGTTIVEMTNGKMMAIAHGFTQDQETTSSHYGTLFYDIWNGSTWGTTTAFGDPASIMGGISAVSDGDIVDFVYLTPLEDIAYMRYNGTGWENEQIVQSAVSPTSVPVLSMNSTSGDFYCFWAGSDNCMWYKKNSGGVWDSTPHVLVNESGETLTRLDGINAFHEFTDYCGVLYETEQQNPYNIKFQVVSPPLVVAISPVSASIYSSQSVTFTSTTSEGTPPYSYQWYLNSTAFSGATLSTWTFTPNTTGSYNVYLVVTDNQSNTAQCTFGKIIVTIPGDINGDFKVGLQDLVLLAQAYGSKPGNTNWNPNADLDGNGVVGLPDLVTLAQHYGQHNP